MSRRCALGLLFVFVVGIIGCSSMGGGNPAGQAQVVVNGVLEPQIESKAEEVFARHGFAFKGATVGRMEFERSGGMMNDLLYGNWQESDTTTRVTLFIIQKSITSYALRTRAMAVRHTFGADADTQLFDIQGAKYKVIIDKIAQELREENSQPSR